MVKIKIYFPQIVLDSKELEVSKDKADDLMQNQNDVDTFIWDNLNEFEQQHTTGKSMITSFLDMGSLKLVTKS